MLPPHKERPYKRCLSSRRTQRSVKSSLPIHILPILRFLLLAHAARVVARHLLLLRGAEAAEAHHGLHGGQVVVLALDFNVVVGLVLLHLGGRGRCASPGAAARGRGAAYVGLVGLDGYVGLGFAGAAFGMGAGWEGCGVGRRW